MTQRRPQILAIDDTPANLLALGAVLEDDFDLRVATSGSAGLALAAQSQPDLILLDVMMPVMNGYETCRQLKQDPNLRAIPVIFLTALSTMDAESEGLALGAADYITKPINVAIARHRIRNLLEREGLRKEVTDQRDALQSVLGQLTESTTQLEAARLRELDMGRNIQRMLLQGEVPEGISGACLDFFCAPSQGVDGDFFDIHRLNADCFDVLVGDVMGKGVQAALIGAAIKASYHQAMADLLMTRSAEQCLPTPAQVINQVHQVLTSRLIALASFATLALYRFDLQAGTLTYVNAGHTPGLLIRADQQHAEAIMGDNLPVGVIAQEHYTERQLPISYGDSLLLFSDGITDALGVGGEEFGQQRLSEAFAAWPQANACQSAARLGHIRQVLQHFTEGTPARDDQTALIVELCR